jgi:ABC-type glycerol-3-phosphate transport system substrate-binding protein
MLMSGPYTRVNSRLMRPEFGWKTHYATALIPGGPSGKRSGACQGGWLIGAFCGSQQKAAALRLLEFLSRPEILAMIAAPENLPPRRSCAALGPFTDPFYEIFFEQLPYARVPYPVVPQLPNVARTIQRAYQRAVSGAATPDETLRWLDDKLTNNILR